MVQINRLMETNSLDVLELITLLSKVDKISGLSSWIKISLPLKAYRHLQR